jgi:hypothetical protein
MWDCQFTGPGYPRPMSTPIRRLVLITCALAFTGCVQTSTPSPSLVPSGQPSAAPSEAPPATSPSASEAGTQSDTEWGRIWDAVPAGFPRFPGSTIADDATAEPVSARFAIPSGDAQAIATWMQDALETATFSTEGLNGPFEDGGFVIDSVGEGDCRIQTTISPEGDLTFISVLYGADCPAP